MITFSPTFTRKLYTFFYVTTCLANAEAILIPIPTAAGQRARPALYKLLVNQSDQVKEDGSKRPPIPLESPDNPKARRGFEEGPKKGEHTAAPTTTSPEITVAQVALKMEGGHLKYRGSFFRKIRISRELE